MYKIKDGKKQEIRSKLSNRKIADKTGYSENYISQIVNGRLASKKVAQAITTTVSSNTELEKYFNLI